MDHKIENYMALSKWPRFSPSLSMPVYRGIKVALPKKKEIQARTFPSAFFFVLCHTVCTIPKEEQHKNMHDIEWQMIRIRMLIYILRSEHVECGCNCSCFRHYSSELSRICKVKPASNIIYCIKSIPIRIQYQIRLIKAILCCPLETTYFLLVNFQEGSRKKARTHIPIRSVKFTAN